MPGGMARVAGSGTEVASMQRGGSSADVWAIASGAVKVEGDVKVLEDFVGMLDNFKFWFNIVTP